MKWIPFHSYCCLFVPHNALSLTEESVIRKRKKYQVQTNRFSLLKFESDFLIPLLLMHAGKMPITEQEKTKGSRNEPCLF